MLKITSSLTATQEDIVYRTIGCAIAVHRESCFEVEAIHKAQTISYLKTVKLPVGLLLNFNSVMLKNGMKRIALSENP